MTDRPIPFSAPMVRALLDGRKTQTRRVLNGKSGVLAARSVLQKGMHWFGIEYDRAWPLRLPYATGDRLWVREAFNAFQFSQDGDDAWPVKIPKLEECKEADELGCRYGAPQIVYRESDRARKWFSDQKWRPSIHMPRWASRLTLIVRDVRVQRLQEISDADALAEGGIGENGEVPCGEGYRDAYWFNHGQDHGESFDTPRDSFRDLWNRLHGPAAWDANPWICAISFQVQKGNIDAL